MQVLITTKGPKRGFKKMAIRKVSGRDGGGVVVADSTYDDGFCRDDVLVDMGLDPCNALSVNHTCTLEEHRRYGGLVVATVMPSRKHQPNHSEHSPLNPDVVSSATGGVPDARQIG